MPAEIDCLTNLDMKDLFAALEKFKADYMRVGHANVVGGAAAIQQQGVDLNARIRDVAGAFALGGGSKGWLGVISDASSLLDELKASLRRVQVEGGPGRQALDSLCLLLDNVYGFINTFPVQIENSGTLGEVYEVIVYKLIADILGLADFGVDKIVEKVDESTRLARVTLNWIKALVPVLITTIVVPLVSVIVVKKIMNNREKTRYNIINNIVSEIYRTLNCYNSQSFDCYHKELKYKDQGILGFWIEILNGKTNTVSREDKIRLLKVISDMQNPDLSVSQKIEFIKLEWGKHLFANSAVV